MVSPLLLNRPCSVTSRAVKPRAVTTLISASGAGFGTASPAAAGGMGGSVTAACADAERTRKRNANVLAMRGCRTRDRDGVGGTITDSLFFMLPRANPKIYHARRATTAE